LKRRSILKLCAAAGAATAAQAIPARAGALVMIGGPMAGSVYFTRDAPGIWLREVERHIPEIQTESAPGETTSVTIKTPHPMAGCGHYIIKHKLLDAQFRLLSQKTFDPNGDAPVSRHALPAGYQGPIYAVSVCNLHDLWIEGTMVGGEGLAPRL
jgi:superoxide reductase